MSRELRVLLAQMKKYPIFIRGAFEVMERLNENELTRDEFFKAMELRERLRRAAKSLSYAPIKCIKAADTAAIIARLPPGSFYDFGRRDKRGCVIFRSWSEGSDECERL